MWLLSSFVFPLYARFFTPSSYLIAGGNYCFCAEERKLSDHERPLIIQLNWGKDDREGRFLLKTENQVSVPVSEFGGGTSAINAK